MTDREYVGAYGDYPALRPTKPGRYGLVEVPTLSRGGVDPSASEIEAERLHHLREMVARGEMSYAEHERHVEVVLCGKQPDRMGRPFMPDPALRRSPFPSPLMEETLR